VSKNCARISRHETFYAPAGVWEEYRYDPLGRRILLRTRRDGAICDLSGSWSCISSTTRFVWAGDQLLWELKQGEDGAPADAVGNVSYTHGGGIDRPLVITKGSVSIVTHENWRGQFARGTYGVNSGRAAGVLSDCEEYPAQGCTPIQWPGERTTVRHELAEPDGQIQSWWGGLVDGMRDASGLQYMRNRYYDPQSGQFTQPDPIGLAGGLNAYGFAAGDPITFADPMGLQVCFAGNRNERRQLERETERAIGAGIDVDIAGCVTRVGNSSSPHASQFAELVAATRTYTIMFNTCAGLPCTVGSAFERDTILLDQNQVGMDLWGFQGDQCVYGALQVRRLAHIIAHELGHAYRANRRGQDELLDLVDFAPDVWGRRRREIGAMIWENTYLNRIGATQRCRY
jgi:RHS repeat-associated protein